MHCKKITYESAREAEIGINKLSKKYKERLFLVPYICPSCEKWHLTSDNKNHRYINKIQAKEIKKLNLKIKELESLINQLKVESCKKAQPPTTL